MFGYVKIYKPELKVKDYEAYKAVYCSLCRQLKKDYGIFAPLTLNYDFTLFALTRLAFSESCCGFKRGSCEYNPLKKCTKCINGDAELSLAAAAAMIMCYYKVQDDIADTSFLKGIAKRLLKPYFSVKRKKAAKRYAEIDGIISGAMQAQAAVEKKSNPGIDAAAHPTAKAMGELLKFGFDGETAEQLERFGYFVGRWVYLMDAFDDMEADAKAGSFNCFNALENERDIIEKVQGALNLTAAQLVHVLEKMQPKRFEDILENIAYDGTYNSMKEIVKKKVKEGGENEQRSV